jgi:hypothetical protein
VSDGVQALRAAAGLSSACDDDCDVDGSGAVTVSDGVNILRKAAGLPDHRELPNDENPVSSLIGPHARHLRTAHKVGAVGGAAVASGHRARATTRAARAEDVGDGFVFTNCDFGDVTFDGFLSTNDERDQLQQPPGHARRGDVVDARRRISAANVGGIRR